MTARQTSVEAYQDISAKGITITQAARILRTVGERKDMTRREIKDATGIEINAVAGRVNALLEQGALVECEPRKCSVTGRMVHPVRIPQQQEVIQ